MITKTQNFKEFSFIDESRLLRSLHVRKPLVFPEQDKDNLLSLVFAPDPETLIPRSDMAIILSHSQNEELSKYIQDNLLRPVNDGSGIDDADFAMQMIKSQSESNEAYFERVRGLISKSE